MNLLLSAGLQSHRRGRFLRMLLNAKPADAQAGLGEALLMMTGEEFQDPSSDQADWLRWAREPGHALLLLPPFNVGPIVSGLDWTAAFAQVTPATAANAPLAAMLAAEVSFQLSGIDGDSDSSQGHVWTSGQLNTRFWKAHSDSGLVAATTLPIWSITLLDSGLLVQEWLAALFSHVGKAAETVVTADAEAVATPTPRDFAVMVCCYAYGVGTPDALVAALQRQPVQLMDVRGFDLPDIYGRLHAMGLVEERGLTTKGLELLRQSAFWGYAARMKEGV
ncbi:hypothetical protein [Roseateles sp. YR242]|uniref:hypothetical protein n=1 Tax=Roseateles sp. YR242 TaxID=1855305 RepID=UPI000B80FD9B|nr:hypothetical protein [Roseateles sp. YR242]